MHVGGPGKDFEPLRITFSRLFALKERITRETNYIEVNLLKYLCTTFVIELYVFTDALDKMYLHLKYS